MSDRDLDYVIVTGAGASCPFGVNGTFLPGMTEWCDYLVKKLSHAGIGYLEASGLSVGLGPQEFERQLGKFLHQVAAFSEIKDLLNPSRAFVAGEHALQPQSVLENWHKATTFSLEQIMNLIHESLYELFAEPSLDIGKAQEAYGGLLRLLGVDRNTRWVYATTNYDEIGESVIQRLGVPPDWGQPPQLRAGGESPLDVDRLIDGLPRYIPVLHLHGRVGWYRRIGSDNRVYTANITKHQAGFGIPIAMLPDPNKVYGTEPIIASLWAQFEQALRRAKRVLVLGHSLNDDALVTAIQENVKPIDRLAVTVLANNNQEGGVHTSAGPVLEKIRSIGSTVGIITMRFGSGPDAGARKLRQWLGKELPD